ncbi:hypothetical protein Zm00014a_008220 [Zea mays]|uniref:Uncharacterized protein n=1 Tax=Zea mays TaxID=4577 RepID=A0A3L6EME2_MAIZE|nr:hypothetical protein Zm00014a_008220 [Zea mays]
MATAVLRRPFLAALLLPAAGGASGTSSWFCPRRRRSSPSVRAVSSDSPKPVASTSSPTGGDSPDEEPPVLPLLQELADCLILPPKLLAQLPSDLRLDFRKQYASHNTHTEILLSCGKTYFVITAIVFPFLKLNDAAFDLSNGPVLDEVPKNSAFSNWIHARGFSTTKHAYNAHFFAETYVAFGKRLVSAGKRFQSMGQYNQGELKKIAETMIKNGKLLSKHPVVQSDVQAMKEKRRLKFGELEFGVTAQSATIGSAVAAIFGLISWQLARGVQSIPDNTMQYTNDNALQLAKSLKTALLVLGYTSTGLSLFAAFGLLLLAQQINSENKSE